MYAGCMRETITITTKALAERAGFDTSLVKKMPDDFILVYDRDDDLVAWGPESDRQEVLRLAKAYE